MIAAWLLYATLLATLFGGAALGITRVAQLGRAPTRGIWLGALLLSVAAPIVGDLVARPAEAGAGPGAGLLALGSRVSIDTPLLVLWGIASLLLFARLVAAVLVLRVRRRGWRETALDGTPVLLTEETGPALMGLTHPRPVIPAWVLELGSRERAMMLLHEAEHARAGDPVLLAIGALSVASMPWNPALWWLARRLRLAIEIDCDARVLRSGADARAYASLLLAVGERMSRTPFAWATALAEPRSLLERRILAMTPSLPRRPLLTIAGFGLVASLAIIAACEAPLPDQVKPETHVSAREALLASQSSNAPVLVTGTLHLGDTLENTFTRDDVPVRYRVVYRIGKPETHPEGGAWSRDDDTGAVSVRAANGTIYYLVDPKPVPGLELRAPTAADSLRRAREHAGDRP